MTVADLIEELQRLPPHRPVYADYTTKTQKLRGLVIRAVVDEGPHVEIRLRPSERKWR